MQIINCDREDIICKVPNLEGVLTSYFGDKDVLLFACLDNDKLSFIGRCGTYCVYIDGDKVLPFGLNEESKLDFYYMDEMHYYPNGFKLFDDEEVICKDKKGNLHAVISYPMEFEEGNVGAFSYFQYNEKKDALCEIRYRHHFMKDKDGKSPIYGYYKTRKMESVYINRDHSKHKDFSHGFIPGSFSHYELISFDSDMLGYNFIAISEHGLLSVLREGSYSLVKEGTANRYLKSYYVKKDGTPLEMPWPICRFYKEEDVIEELTGLGFGTEVPEELIYLYNGESHNKKLIDQLINMMNGVIEAKDIHKYMLLRKKID